MTRIKLKLQKITFITIITLLSGLKSDIITQAETVDTNTPELTITHPLQTVPGQECLVYDDKDDKDTPPTLQETYIKTEKSWSYTEEWVWKKICQGEIADLDSEEFHNHLFENKNKLDFVFDTNLNDIIHFIKTKSNTEDKNEEVTNIIDTLFSLLPSSSNSKENYKNLQNLVNKIAQAQGTKSNFTEEKKALEKIQTQLLDMEKTNTNINNTNTKQIEEYKKILDNLHNSPHQIYSFNIYSFNNIRYSFLETILLREPFKAALPKKVSIQGADFCNTSEDKEIKLSSQIIDKELHLKSSIFHCPVRFYNSQFLQSLYFQGSTFNSRLELNNAIIHGSLYLRGVKFQNATHETLNLNRIEINKVLKEFLDFISKFNKLSQKSSFLFYYPLFSFKLIYF